MAILEAGSGPWRVDIRQVGRWQVVKVYDGAGVEVCLLKGPVERRIANALAMVGAVNREAQEGSS